MGFDWQDLERREERRFSAVVLPLGVVFLLGGLAALTTYFTLGRPSTPAGGAVWAVLGAAMITQSLLRRRRERLPARGPESRDPEER